MILIALCIIIASAILFVALFPLARLLENVIALPILMMAQIVLATQALSMTHQISGAGYMVAHVLMLLASLALWLWRGRPAVMAPWQTLPKSLRWLFVTHNRLLVLACLILLFVAYRALDGALRETFFLDAFVYHIPRALFWLQNGTAEHFFTQNFRLVEFPPNASFVYAWMIAMSGQTLGLNLPQAVAALVMMLTTISLARYADFSWEACLFAGITIPFVLEVGQQISEAQIDLIVAALTSSTILFAISVFQIHKEGVPLHRNPALLYMGISFGLALGTKFTALFMLPGAAIALLIYALYLFGQRSLPLLVACTLAASGGFLIFGSYNYVLNTMSFGNPFTAQGIENSSDLINQGTLTLEDVDTLRAPLANGVRYIYHLLGIEYFQAFVPFINIEQAKSAAFETLFTDVLGISFNEIGGLPLYQWLNLRTFMLIVPLALFVSGLAFFVHLWRARLSERNALLAVLIACSWSWITLTSILVLWSGLKMRLFVIIVPTLLAATMPYLYPRLRWQRLLIIPIAFVMLYSAILQVVVPKQTYESFEFYAEQVIRPLVEDGETLGLMADQAPLYTIMTIMPDVTFQFIPTEQVAESLQSGQVAAIIAHAKYCNQDRAGIERAALSAPQGLLFTCVYTAEA